MAADKAPHAEKVLDNVIDKVQNGGLGGFFQELWENNQDSIMHFGKVLVLSLAVILLAGFISRIVRKVIMKSTEKITVLDSSIGKVLYGIARTVIWLFAFLIILDLFGINTASILTVLGAAGLAVGLAMKDSLSNIAAGLMLLFLHPYKVGDYVDAESVSGTIKEMGLFTTELMTPDGLYVSAPNSVIFGKPIKNFSRNPLRRTDIKVGISYGDSLPQGIEILKKMMMENELILKEPAPEVLVSDLADSSVNLTLRYWTSTQNYWPAFWSIKGNLKQTIESAGLNIPFPQRVVTFANAIPENTEKK